MKKAIDFYFDFSSPYGYLGSKRIEALASKYELTINWQPILLGAVFKVSGQAPLTTFPLKGEYALMDFERSAREHGTPYKQPKPFPIAAVAASRAFYWISENPDAAIAAKTANFVHAVFAAYYVEQHDISKADVLAAVVNKLGLNSNTLAEALGQQAVKDRLKNAVDDAIARGVFGSPMMYYGDEPFWGNDRIEQLERWIEKDGW
ncbi:MAG: 2-hydroxychromene-2-carboxylate isomerase [Granulosicoccaceae bacterium]